MQVQDLDFVWVTVLPDGRLDAKNAATYLGLAEKTLVMMRSNGSGPRYVKRGRVFYFKDDLDEWVHEGRVSSTAQMRPIARIQD